jgi:hypothetical protein
MCDISLAFRVARLVLAVLFSDWPPILNFALQCVALGVLVWYALETLRIRKASQEQAEAVQRPCLTLATAARGYEDAVLEMGGAVGGMIVAAREGNVALWNVGSGPAINARYSAEKFIQIGPTIGWLLSSTIRRTCKAALPRSKAGKSERCTLHGDANLRRQTAIRANAGCGQIRL